MPQKRHGGPPARRQTARAFKRIRDRHHVLDLKIKGLSYRQIGAQLGISDVHAMDLAFEAGATLIIKDQRQVEILRAIENERLDEAHRAMVPLQHGQVPGKAVVVGAGKTRKVGAVPPDPVDVARVQGMAVQRIVNISGRRAALNGLDAPIKVAQTDPGGTRRYHDLSEDELERVVQEQRRLLGDQATACTCHGLPLATCPRTVSGRNGGGEP